jgi:hypothetical protein
VSYIAVITANKGCCCLSKMSALLACRKSEGKCVKEKVTLEGVVCISVRSNMQLGSRNQKDESGIYVSIDAGQFDR